MSSFKQNNKSMRITFKLNNAETKIGEILYVVGSIASLGEWKDKSALQMTTSAKDYPCWSMRDKDNDTNNYIEITN